MLNRTDPVALEQLWQQPRHGETVLEHVGDPRRSAHVVLEHPPASGPVADEIAAADMTVDTARRADSVHRTREGRAADHQRPGHDPRPDDLVRVIDVVDERIERADALGQAALDHRPFRARQYARHEVHRPGPIPSRAVVAGDLERDPLLHEDGVASPAGGLQARGSHAGQRGQHPGGVVPRRAVGCDALVPAAIGDLVAGQRVGSELERHRRAGLSVAHCRR